MHKDERLLNVTSFLVLVFPENVLEFNFISK